MARSNAATKKAAKKKKVVTKKAATPPKGAAAKKKTATKKASAAKKANSAKKASSAKKNAAAAKPTVKATKKVATKKARATKKVSPENTGTSKKSVARRGASAAKAATKASPKKSKAKVPSSKVKLPAFLTDKKWLKQQREQLISERATYTHNAEALLAEAAALMADRDPGDVQFDEESGEGDTLAVERDRDLALSAKAREKIDEIDAALARLDKGKYGQCVSRDEGDFIPKERLEALPMAAKCVKHQTAMF